MKIIDGYILKELIRPFVFGICAFASVFIGGGTMWRIAQYVSEYGASWTVVWKLFIYSLPSVIVITVPMAMLLAVLLCFSRLSGNGEITALKASGQSFARLAAPVFVAAFIIALITVFFNETLVPMSTAVYNQIVRCEIENKATPKSQNHVVMIEKGSDNSVNLTYASKFDGTSNRMSDVTVQKYKDDSLVLIEKAAAAVWQADGWVMYSGVINELTGQGSRTMFFQEQKMPLAKSPEKLSIEQKKPEELTIRELKQRIKMFKQVDNARLIYEVELHQRLSVPMAAFVFAVVGAPLGLVRQRAGSATGLGMSILIIFAYYVLMMFATTLGQTGKISAVLAAWLPNLAGVAAGVCLIRRAQ